MLNLIDASSRQAIVDRADPSKVYDLSVDNFVGMPGWFGAEDQPYQIGMTHTPHGEEADDVMRVGKASNELVSYSGDSISMYTHTGTHIDALNHFGYHGRIFNGFSVDEHLGSRAWRKAGADKHPPIIARRHARRRGDARRRCAGAELRHRAKRTSVAASNIRVWSCALAMSS